MVGSYNSWLVFLSIVVATIASYVALDLASRVVATHGGRAARYWLVGGGRGSLGQRPAAPSARPRLGSWAEARRAPRTAELFLAGA